MMTRSYIRQIVVAGVLGLSGGAAGCDSGPAATPPAPSPAQTSVVPSLPEPPEVAADPATATQQSLKQRPPAR